MFQKNFCKISSIDSSRYFAIIIPSVLSVFEEIKNLKNIFLQRRFFFQIAKYYYNIISSKPKWNKEFGGWKKIFDICEHYSYITFSVVIKIFKKKTHQIIFLFFVQLSLIFFTENSVKSTSTTKESTSSSNYLRNHHQPDLVKVSQSPKVVTSNAELARLEHILDEKNRENERLRARLGHNAKGFEALAVTVNHLAKKVNWIFNYYLIFRRV